jgi:hypothetical protein
MGYLYTTFIRLHVKCAILATPVVSPQIFVKVQSIKFHDNPFSGRRADTCGWA